MILMFSQEDENLPFSFSDHKGRKWELSYYLILNTGILVSNEILI